MSGILDNNMIEHDGKFDAQRPGGAGTLMIMKDGQLHKEPQFASQSQRQIA